jgi:NAD+ synthetase
MNYQKVVQNIRNDLRTYVKKHGLKSLVLGVSGGADSALIAALASPVCAELHIPLIGLSIPIQTNKEDELVRARLIGKNFCTVFHELNLSSAFQMEQEVLWDPVNDLFPMTGDADVIKHRVAIAKGNLKARMRMRLIYHVAGITEGLVLGTDNLTEYNVGFWTIFGDVGDYGMIQNLWKTEVYQIMLFLADELESLNKHDALIACVEAIPTDGLGITSSDLEQLGADTYAEVDKILQAWTLNCVDRDAYKEHPVVLRHEKTHYKRNHPYNIPRDVLLKGA